MNVAVLGATESGRAVAGWCACMGMTVRLYGEDANIVMDSIDAIERQYGVEASDTVDGTTGREAAVSGADFVVDATNEDTAERRVLLADLESFIDEDTVVVIGDRHSTITAVAAGLRRPGRAIGVHVIDTDQPSVIEVIIAEQTTFEARERTTDFVGSVGGTPLIVRDTPGFTTTRLDLATIAEAVRMVEDGVASVRDIDRALELGRDHPIGPLGLADQLGLDSVLDALEALALDLGGRFDPPDLLFEKVTDGDLGRQTGTGFYEWENSERSGPAEPNPTIEARTDTLDAPEDR